LTGSILESIRSSFVMSVLNSEVSKLSPVRLPAVEENLIRYSAAASFESISSPGAVNSIVTASLLISTILRSVT